MFRTIPYCLITLAIWSPVRAVPQDHHGTPEEDTVRVYHIGEVVIPADRYPESAEAAGAVAYGVDPQAGTLGPAASIGDLLEGGRGVHLLRYGGGLSLQTLSVRGLGSENTALLINGMPGGNPQGSVSDLGLLGAGGFSGLRVLPGGATAIYGSGAVGGAVNLSPRFPERGDSLIETGFGTGSFGESSRFLRATWKHFPGTAFSVSGSSSRGRGDYTYTGRPEASGDTDPAVRLNNDYQLKNLTFNTAGRPWNGLNVETTLMISDADQGSPGAGDPGPGSPTARRNDRRLFAGAWVASAPKQEVSWVAAGTYDLQYERYLDPGSVARADNYYRVRTGGLAGQGRYGMSDNVMLTVGTEISRSVSDGNSGQGERGRTIAALSGSVPLQWTPSSGGHVHAWLTPLIRVEGGTGIQAIAIWKIGMNLSLEGTGAPGDSPIRIHSTVGNGRRIPSFNDLYYAAEGGRGNPALKPEYSTAFDAGVGAGLPFLSGFSWDLTYYRIKLTDRIVWLPTSLSRTWSPVNIGESVSSGWEAEMHWKVIPARLEFSGNYGTINSTYIPLNDGTTTSYEKQLIYIPLDNGSLNCLVSFPRPTSGIGEVFFDTRAIYTGTRYTVEDNSESLPGVWVVDAGIGAEVTVGGISARVVYHARNLTGESYSVVPGYPMPGFNQSVGIIIRLGN